MTLEGELLVRIKHPYVVDVFETGVTSAGLVWIRMELLRGMTLREMLRRRGLLSIALVCAYLRHAALAAHQCHVLGVIHRDIKPENIFVTSPDEIAKLLDFGLAKLQGSPDTAEGQRHGTPLYMAPEQIRAHRVTPATDVYALGMVAYEALSGAHPFVEDAGEYDLYALYHKHFSELPLPLTELGVPREISDVITRALEKDPRRRYPNGLAFAETLWGAWQRVEQMDPISGGTNPGEPSIEQILSRAQDGLRFGTGPTEGEATASGAPLPPRAQTERLPDSLRDPSSVRALADRAVLPRALPHSEHRGHGAPPNAGWQPVLITEPLPTEEGAARVAAPERRSDDGRRGQGGGR